MAIVEALDVLEELMPNIMDVNWHAIKQLGFYAANRRFCDGIVPTVATPAHTLHHAEFP